MENKNYRILNLEGAWLEKEEYGFRYSTKDNYRLYSATMPYSLETLRAFDKLPKEVFKVDGEQYTKLFVNFKFSKDYFEDNEDNEDDEGKVRINKKKLRKLIYTSTVKIDNVEYQFFKRGASKARTANVIFCKKEYRDLLLNPCLLGLKFIEGKEYDITSKEAYTSLIMSGIVGTLDIKKDEILIINDLESPKFNAMQSLTLKNEDNIYQDVGEFKVSNNMTDGQGSMDESVFLDNELINKSTCVLLRNDFTKCNACRTRLQEYYKQNNITKVYDMFRGELDASKIKLVITPSSCKYLKFSNQFTSKKECYLDWWNRIPSTFGVVKTDHIGNYGYSNRLSYQMLNSMNLSRQDVQELMQDELNYYKLLKDNTLATSADVKKMSKKGKAENREQRNKMDYFLRLTMDKSDKLSTGDMIADLLKRNIDFRLTKKFKDWKKEQLRDYVENLRQGKIRVINSLYAIMISCPYEMLVATTKQYNKVDNCITDGWECYCPSFTNGAELLGIRNPQINAGNIAHLTNKYHDQFKWFGYWEDGKAKHDFVVFVNTYNVDLMNRLQGCDFDIDTVLLTDNKLLVQKAKESQSWETPTNGIQGTKENREYSDKSLAELDNYLGGSTMAIGKIVNKSAIFNGYMYNAINNNYSKDYIDKCFEASSTLSSFSQIAIDMAKKNFEGLSLTKEMNLLNKKTYTDSKGKEQQILQYKIDRENVSEITIEDYIKEVIKKKKDKNYTIKCELIDTVENLEELIELYKKYKEDKKKDKKKADENIEYEIFKQKIKCYMIKMIVPYFFKYIAQDNSYRIPIKMDCGMDYLEDILDDLDTKAMQVDKVEIKDLLVLQKELEGGAYDGKNIDETRKIIDNCFNVLNKNRIDKNDTEQEINKKNNFKRWIKKQSINKLKSLEMNKKTIHRILQRAFNIDINYKGLKLHKLDKEGKEIIYKGSIVTVRELKEMTMLTLTLIYNSYPDTFIECFIENKKEIENIRFWL